MSLPVEDTIAAISTPQGEGAIGLVRLSGPQAFSIARGIFRPGRGEPLDLTHSHRLHYGHICDSETGQVLDEVLLSVLKAPRTYTREDMIEINCHGGPSALEQVLRLTLRAGARLAEPGEFTKRAFLNGRIDLTQAEAVIDVIQARTELSLKAAVEQLGGRLSDEVNELQRDLVGTLAEIEAAIDFPEEDLDFEDTDTLADSIEAIRRRLEQLLDTAQDGKILREGVRTAIVGRTNVGKSSLLNVLLREERAIVTPVPGTTRDTIEEALNLHGLMLRLIDTAGLRDTEDAVEQISIERSRAALDRADLLLIVLDTSEPLTEEDRGLLHLAERRVSVCIGNKADLPPAWDVGALDHEIVRTSMMRGTGIETLKDAIWDRMMRNKHFMSETAIVTNVRHQRALEQAKEALEQAEASLHTEQPYEFVALDLRITLDRLGLIVGRTTTDDILDRIFAQFCIGK